MWPEIEIIIRENKRELKLSGAAISERIDCDGLDETIFNLSALNLLNISETTLSTVPDNVSNLKNLQTLLLYGNQLEKLPDSFDLLDKLKIFDVSRNHLTCIPLTISRLTNLTTINCSSNQLTAFPTLDQCSKLSTLDLSDNKLTEFPDICRDTLANLSEINLKGNQITGIPNSINRLCGLKHFNLVANKISALPKNLTEISKLKDLHLEENPIADKRLLKLIQQCRTKQIMDYVKQHGTDAPINTDQTTQVVISSSKSTRKQKKSQSENRPQHKFVIQRHTDETIRLIYMQPVKDIRPFILCCIVKQLCFTGDNFQKFLRIQTKLHETICGKRERSTIATHDLKKLQANGTMAVRYTARQPNDLTILPLGRVKPCTAQQLYDYLKAEAEALRKEKKRNVYSGIHKYLYLLDKKDMFACLEDKQGNVISLPPLINGDLTKISPTTTDLFIEVTSSTQATDCRATIEALLHEMLMAGFGVVNSTETMNDECNSSTANQLIVQQVKITDFVGNLRTVYPSKTDLQFDENSGIFVERESM